MHSSHAKIVCSLSNNSQGTRRRCCQSRRFFLRTSVQAEVRTARKCWELTFAWATGICQFSFYYWLWIFSCVETHVLKECMVQVKELNLRTNKSATESWRKQLLLRKKNFLFWCAWTSCFGSIFLHDRLMVMIGKRAKISHRLPWKYTDSVVVQTLAQEVQKLFLTSLELELEQNFGWIAWSFSKVCSLTTVWTSMRLKSNYYMDNVSSWNLTTTWTMHQVEIWNYCMWKMYQVEIWFLHGQMHHANCNAERPMKNGQTDLLWPVPLCCDSLQPFLESKFNPFQLSLHIFSFCITRVLISSGGLQ